MKKLILKTSLLTLAGVILIGALTFYAISIFSPLTVAKAFDKVDNYKISVHYYEKQYENTEDYEEDLKNLCIKIDEQEDSERAEKYLKLLCEDYKFKKFCQNTQLKMGEMSVAEYFYCKYTSAVLTNHGEEKAIEVANDYAKLFTHTRYEPLKVLNLNK